MDSGIRSDAPRVREYMTGDVISVDTDMPAREAIQMMHGDEGHSGFPVCNEGCVVGFISARDLLIADKEETVGEVMSTDLLVARPEMKVKNAARVILRSGIQRLPVIDDAGNLIGIISHADVVRSQIERTSHRKVAKLQRTLELVHDVELDVEEGTVTLEGLIPTQSEVYADELEGRRYELEKGLSEPIVAIRYGDDLVLADGHHRARAAKETEEEELTAYIISVPRSEVELGLYEQAIEAGLESISDIKVIDYARHPLIEQTNG